MNTNEMIDIITKLESGKISIDDMGKLCANHDLTYKQVEQFIYSVDRSRRFELFLTLYNNTLKNSSKETLFKSFRESYCASDNIYAQINNSRYNFSLKGFLAKLKNSMSDFMSEEEKIYYDNLPETFTIYRGMSNKEQQSENYGISWTLSEDTAKKYVYFDKNKVQECGGGVANLLVAKADIVTVFNVHGEMEIIYLR
ncbi:hypothetical protein NXY32_06210 [Bacteroides fragilis]|jgi:hypothetical protein|nr:hypothetical protein [Bacteroides fragilis]